MRPFSVPRAMCRLMCCASFLSTADRNFVLGNAQVNSVPIIYSNEGFCRLTGYSRAELMQKHCSCDFLCGEETNNVSARAVKAALRGSEEKKIEIVYYKKDGKISVSVFRYNRMNKDTYACLLWKSVDACCHNLGQFGRVENHSQ